MIKRGGRATVPTGGKQNKSPMKRSKVIFSKKTQKKGHMMPFGQWTDPSRKDPPMEAQGI